MFRELPEMSSQSRLIETTKEAACALEVLTDPAANITVERAYSPDWLNPDLWLNNPDLANTFTGRKVYVLPVSERQEGPTSRDHDDNRYGVGVVVLERYPGAEPVPPVEWVDERIAWMESKVLDFLGDARHPAFPGADPVIQEWVKPYDPDLLRQHKLLRSEVLITFRRIEPGPGVV
jgi:hypothetical protein